MNMDGFGLHFEGEEKGCGDLGVRRGRTMGDPQVSGSANCWVVASRGRELWTQNRFWGNLLGTTDPDTCNGNLGLDMLRLRSLESAAFKDGHGADWQRHLKLGPWLRLQGEGAEPEEEPCQLS